MYDSQEEDDYQPEVLHYPNYDADSPREENDSNVNVSREFNSNTQGDEDVRNDPNFTDTHSTFGRDTARGVYGNDPTQTPKRKHQPRTKSSLSETQDRNFNQSLNENPKSLDQNQYYESPSAIINQEPYGNSYIDENVVYENNQEGSQNLQDPQELPLNIESNNAPPSNKSKKNPLKSRIPDPPIQDNTFNLTVDHPFTEYKNIFPQEVLHYTISSTEEDTRYNFFDTLHGIFSWFYWGFSGSIREGIEVTSHRIRKQRTEIFGPHFVMTEKDELLCNLQHITMRKRVLPRMWFEIIDNVFLRLFAIIFMHSPFVLSIVNNIIAISIIFHYGGLITFSIIQGFICLLMIVQIIVCIGSIIAMINNNYHIPLHRVVLFLGLYVVSLLLAVLSFILSFISLVPNGNVTVGIIVLVICYLSSSIHFLALIHNPQFRHEYKPQITLYFSDLRSQDDKPDTTWEQHAQFQKFKDYALVGCLCGAGIGIVWTLLWYFIQRPVLKKHHENFNSRTIDIFMDEKNAEEMIRKIWNLRDDIKIDGYNLDPNDNMY